MRTLLFTMTAALLASRPDAGTNLGQLHELLDFGGRPFDRLEASGVAYFRGRLAVVDDTVNTIFLFDLRGQLVRRIESPRFPHQQAKFEDIAFRPKDGSFLAVGSHSGWDNEALERQSVLVEFRLRTLDEIDDNSVQNLPLYREFDRLGLWKPRGMKIEGLTVDDEDGALYVGLREPIDRARVYRFTAAPSMMSLGSGRGVELVLEFDAGIVEETPYCVSALAWDAERQGLWIMTSTENEDTHRFLGNRLWFWFPGRGPQLVLDRFDDGLKAEGLTLGAERLFIVYDNDQDDTQIPSQIRVVPLERLHDRVLKSE